LPLLKFQPSYIVVEYGSYVSCRVYKEHLIGLSEILYIDLINEALGRTGLQNLHRHRSSAVLWYVPLRQNKADLYDTDSLWAGL